MRVSELAIQAGVTADTVRYYTKIGLITPTKNIENGYKNYKLEDQKRLNFILKARQLGFSITEIQEIVNLSSGGESPCCRVREIVKKRLHEAAKAIEEMQRLHARMQRAADTWEDMPDGQPTNGSVCSLIERWESVGFEETVEKVG